MGDLETIREGDKGVVMQLIDLERLEKLIKDGDAPKKHVDYWKSAKVSYPEVWYRLWLGRVKDYLVQRLQRRK